MSKCPYTWVKNLFRGGTAPSGFRSVNLDPRKRAETLRVVVAKNGETRVDVSLPAHSARWLIELIPPKVLEQIRDEKIPIEDLFNELKSQTELFCSELFLIESPDRKVEVWLE